MSYYYGSLGPERFQELTQSLLLAEFPNAQCLPIGQRDGGRDAIAFRHLKRSNSDDGLQRELIVFQVKYSREGGENREQRDFLEDFIKKESEKIVRLKQQGLKTYYLITNIAGTAYPNSGSIDKVNKFLSERLGIEAYCWWRDDIDRRLDKNGSVKWSYPEILKATDVIQHLLGGSLGEAEEARMTAIKAYMSSQYDDEEELKFKQVELQSKLIDLFVDLPMSAIFSPDDAFLFGAIEHERVQRRRHYYISHQHSFGAYTENALAVDFFLKDTKVSKIVLEGAPGQGKSTVTQYLCQVMRMHLLGKKAALEAIPENGQQAQVRIPFRVDMRDLARWISGQDPFDPKHNKLTSGQALSLEGFLAAQVRNLSGGHDFSVADLAAITKSSHVLIALDGFDEVAEIDVRKLLVKEISKATSRIENSGALSLQVIVTSRPAAFAKSVRFPDENWSYFELLDLTPMQVNEYADKWMLAKNFKESEKAEFVKILESKLSEPHTRYLARNPMQLTILLALVHSLGESLPEKRTAMYDKYMELFFSRESEKSEIVKKYRDLLIDLHRYLAWCLQTSAESGESGSIEQEQLKQTLHAYLLNQGEKPDLVDELFKGVVERVGALVSRVQGTFEFEVQPLREYFVARYLYETAPYSPTGSERYGTKIDRFYALAKNPYWLNVARFYAGCFSKGEVSALVDAFREIANSSTYCSSSHPRRLAWFLLGDWVFTQYQPAVKNIVEFICDENAIRQFISGAEFSSDFSLVALPERCGRDTFVEMLLNRSIDNNFMDENKIIGSVISRNLTKDEIIATWIKTADRLSKKDWIRLGANLNVFEIASDETILSYFEESEDTFIMALLRAQKFDLLESSVELFEAAKSVILSSAFSYYEGSLFDLKSPSALRTLATILNPYPYDLVFHRDFNESLKEIVGRYFSQRRANRANPSVTGKRNETAGRDEVLNSLVQAYLQFCGEPVVCLSTSLAPWDKLLQELEKYLHGSLAVKKIAIKASFVRSKVDRGKIGDNIFDDAPSIAQRYRFARLKSGAPKWWQKQLELANNFDEQRLVLLLVWAFATPNTLLTLRGLLYSILKGLDDTSWNRLVIDFNDSQVYGPTIVRGDVLTDPTLAELGKLSPRYLVVLAAKLPVSSKVKIVRELLQRYSGDDHAVNNFICRTLLDNHSADQPMTYDDLSAIKRSYKREALQLPTRGLMSSSLGIDIAQLIADDSDSYPLPLLLRADSDVTTYAGETAAPLHDVARSEKWFEQIS